MPARLQRRWPDMTRVVIGFLLAVPLLYGCASRSQSNPFSDSDASSSEIQVTIRNEGPRPRQIYAFWENRNREWVGTVAPDATRTFTLRYRSEGIRFTGGPRVFVSVFPGDHLQVVFPRIGTVQPPGRVRSD